MNAPLVGRAGELDLLVEVVEQVAVGRGGLVHLVGEAGIGKSSLLAAASTLLRERGVVVRAVSVDETDRRRHGAVVRSLLREPLGDGDLGDVAIASLERAALDGPLALVADDLHWADDASLSTLRSLARRLEPLGVLVLTSARPDPRPAALARLEDAVRHVGHVVELLPLSDWAVESLVVRAAGGRPGPNVRVLVEACGGNPFLATELLVSLADELTRTGDIVDVPESAVMSRHLAERLASHALGAVPGSDLLLRALAVVPGGAKTEELADILGRPTGDIIEVALRAVAAAVLVDNGTTLAFRHELLRRCVHSSTPPSIAHTLTRLAGDVLVERAADPDRIATCLLAGVDLADPLDVERLLAVGTELRELHPSAAADLLDAGLGALARHDGRGHDLTLELGWALVEAGRAGEVAAVLGRRFDDGDEVPMAVHRLRGVAASLTGRLDAVNAQYEWADPTAIAPSDVNDPDVVDAAVELAMLRIATGRIVDATAIADWAERTSVAPTPRRSAGLAVVRAQVAGAQGRFETAVDQARSAAGWARRDDSGRPSWATGSLVLAMALDQLGDADGALFVARDQSAAPRWIQPMLQFNVAATLFRRGDWDDALAEIDAGLVAADEVDLSMGLMRPAALAAWIATARGHAGEARTWLDRAVVGTGGRQLGGDVYACAAALTEEAAGCAERAVPLIELVVAGATAAGAPGILVGVGPELAGLALVGGRDDLAKTIGDLLALAAERTRSPVVAGAERLVRGRLEHDVATLAEAASMFERAGRRPEAARAHHAAAVVSAERGDRERAKATARTALNTYDQLEAAHWRRQLLAEMADAGVVMRPRRQTPRPASGWDSLTSSEATIVELVGEGLTNTVIADRLYVSRRTVESHLGRAYAKLELRSRAELIAAVARR